MTPPNPTQLRLGARGTLDGRQYQVAGRVVMSVRDRGEFYFWNEFQLKSDSGEQRILVYEETARGGKWRFFTRFEPAVPRSIPEAEEKTMGDVINLDGTNVSVTFIGRSRVSQIEGWAPKGEYVGKEEQYFNAEAGSKMIVVSYTPDQIEFYNGETIFGGVVEHAFSIPKPPRSAYALNRYGGASPSDAKPLIVMTVLCIFVCLMLILPSLNCTALRQPAVRVFPDLNFPIVDGFTIHFQETNYQIAGDDIVEIDEQGLRFSRHEFTLTGPDGRKSWMIAGLQPGGGDWCFLTAVAPDSPMTPRLAGGVQAGQFVRAEGKSYIVSNIFLSRPKFYGTNVTYGFSAQSGTNILLARWDESGITYESGAILTPQAVRVFTNQFSVR